MIMRLRCLVAMLMIVASAATAANISGTVKDVPGNSVGSVLITLSGYKDATQLTASNGTYSFGSLSPWHGYTVTPSKAGCTFFPTFHYYMNLGGSAVADFVATCTLVGPNLIAPADQATGIPVSGTILSWEPSISASSYDVYFGTDSNPVLAGNSTSTQYALPQLSYSTTYYWRVVAKNESSTASSATWSFTTAPEPPPAGLRFVPIAPCRVVDTRPSEGKTGLFGPPAIAGQGSRDIPIPTGSCPVPATAAAYSVSVTVVPPGPLGYLTVWPTGQPQPYVSTVNSTDGSVVANAAIVPAGTDGSISVFASNDTDLVIDINGYFDAQAGSAGNSFYSVNECRLIDTRNDAMGTLGTPMLSGQVSRDFDVVSGACGLAAGASAYSFAVTAVPPGTALGYLTMWPTGQAQPYVSTVNAMKGLPVTNMAIVPAGDMANANKVSVFASNDTDLVVDVNGYFGTAGGTNEMVFHPMAPCRLVDTRNPAGPFGGPAFGEGESRDYTAPSSTTCTVPSNALAYSMNVTVVPSGPLGYLTVWPTGNAQPNTSNVTSMDGLVVANAVITGAGAGGTFSVFASNPTEVVIDMNGYFTAP